MATSAYEHIRREALGLMESTTAIEGNENVDAAVRTAVDSYQSRAHEGAHRPLRDPAEMADRVRRSITAFGPLTRLFEHPGIEEIFIEGDIVTYVAEGGALHTLHDPTSTAETRHLLSRLLADTDRHIDVSTPIVQARVLGGTARLTAVIAPVADRLSATIRRYALRRETVAHLVGLGGLSPAAGGFLWAAMQARTSVLISGPPGAGKTSLLAALLDCVPADHCVRCVEEVRELNVRLSPHSSFYQARPPGPDGRGEISLRHLVKLVLAMRPDRIVVGEVRGAEAFELTRASNAGCGFCCTIHANSAPDALEALVNAALMAGENVTEAIVRKVFASSIDVVVHLDRRSRSGEQSREVAEILTLSAPMAEGFTTDPIFRRSHPGRPLEWSGALPREDLASRIEAGMPPEMKLKAVCEGTVSPL